MYDFIDEVFPEITFAMTYGSGAFQQSGNKNPDMVDFVFAVENAEKWHEQNMQQNGSHYSSFARVLGSKYVSNIQDNYGAGIYYNTLVPISFNGAPNIKYGVVTTKHLIQDLEKWNTMYVSGRMHKPVYIIKSNSQIDDAQEINLQNAINTSLLLLPEKFTKEELYLSIAGLSYLGDPRVGIAENPNKVRNIVGSNIKLFDQWYSKTIQNHNSIRLDKDSGTYLQDKSIASIQNTYHSLPLTIKEKFKLYDCMEASTRGPMLHLSVSEIVRKYSTSQSIKGVFTAGISKSAIYLGSKLIKMIRAAK